MVFDSQLYKQTFFPYATAAADRLKDCGNKLVYYTTAATAVQILLGRQIWMRNTLVMNDVTEVRHGLNCISRAFDSPAGKALDDSLDTCFPGISGEIKAHFKEWIPGFGYDTFITCFSEHDPNDYEHGRLSMWRAYGGDAGVALVLNGDAFLRPSQALAAYSSPVAYLDAEGVQEEVKNVANQLQANRQFVQGLGRDSVKNALFHMLRFAAVSIKHPAFIEEREWRVIASPSIESSPFVTQHVETIGSIPQTVLKIGLVDLPDNDIDLTPSNIVDRVLIGPCEHPDVIWRALYQALSTAGVASPDSKIHKTGIPLRTNQR